MRSQRKLSSYTATGICIFRFIGFILLLAVSFSSCTVQSSGHYFGKTVAPKDNVLRYISGSEPETLDPQIPDGQPEARVLMALYDGLIEYHPKTLQPIPAIAKSWEISPRVDEFLFHLRDNAKWSDGTPITSKDFVYTIRRGFRAETLSRTANLGYFIKYSEGFNSGGVFVKKGNDFLLDKDFGGSDTAGSTIGPETEFHKFLHSPDRLVLPGNEKDRAKQLNANPKLKAAVEGTEFVPIKEEDIGVEAIDDYTLRITLRQSAPFFLGLLGHQFFRVIPQSVVEKYGKDWVRPEHIVTSGAFRVKVRKPYDVLSVEKNPNYWDAANVHLDGIDFYPVEEQSTQLSLYKAGSIDAFLNHTVLLPWIDTIKQYTDEYMNFPEAATMAYGMNMTKPPFDNPKVRMAFSLAVDRVALSNFRKITKPLFSVTPGGVFPEYDRVKDSVRQELNAQKGSNGAQINEEGFDPELARKLLGDAGFPVVKNGDEYSCSSFPIDKAELAFNTAESNRQVAEFVQAQWARNLGITIPLNSMEFKTFLPFRHELQYPGFGQTLWSADYMDPYTFLSLYYDRNSNGDTGFNDPKFKKMLDDANAELDSEKRYEMLARAEYYLRDQMPVITLTINATNWMKKPYVKGMYPNPMTLLPWKFVYIEQDPAKWDHDVDNIMVDTDQQVQKQLDELTSTQTAPTAH
jgi:oligopeptide transport system substrate-binding protein